MTETSAPTQIQPAPATAAERLALRIIQAGAIAVVLVVTTLNAFELDRFFVPKELALHVTAIFATVLAFRAVSRIAITRVDLFLAIYLLLGAASSALATNRFLALRNIAISASGIAIFWTARALRERGLGRPLINGLALAVVLTAITCLLQTYGLETVFFSENRVPGGTLGNRNFIAHAGAFGFPVVLLAALYARRERISLASSFGVTIVTASLVLTRSRAAWIAFAAMMFVFVVAMLISGPLRRDLRMWGRLAVTLVLVLGGVAAALLIPNTLKWHSDNPYLESVKNLAEYQRGSGRGRLLQYERSLLMAIRHPLFGVGPGNWSVEYPENAARHDPSLNDSERGMTFNPWPSSDWIAIVSERGFIAFFLFVLALLSIAASGLRQLVHAHDAEEAIVATALLGTVVAAIIAGLFDAVLLLGVPSLLVWAALGALWHPESSRPRPAFWALVVAGVIAIALIGAGRSAMQLDAMHIYATRGDRASLERAAHLDPGNYRLQLRLARSGSRRQRCPHALAAHALFPNAEAAAAAARGCE